MSLSDIKAMYSCDIGISFASSSSSAAIDTSDLVCLNDCFDTILGTVIYGRNIVDNVRRFLAFQLTANVSTCLSVFLIGAIYEDPEFTSTQLLWVNMIMDTLAAMALASQKPIIDKQGEKPTSMTKNNKLSKEKSLMSGEVIRLV